MDERDDIVEYINSLDKVNGKTEKEVRDGFQTFKVEKIAAGREISGLSAYEE
jgi:type I restriction enzyme R subunit